MKQVNFRVSEEMYALLASEADRVNRTPSAYAKQKIEYHLTGGNAQIDRLSSSIEQLTHRVYASHNELDLLCNKMIEVITGMHEYVVSMDEKFSERANRIQQAVNFCAANFEIKMKKEGSRDAVVSMWKSLNKITGISKNDGPAEG
jgi:hypothetical protein